MIRPALTVIDVEFKETTTTLVIREDGEVPVSEVVPVGTRAVEAAISEYVHREAGLQIGERTAESLKLRTCSARRCAWSGSPCAPMACTSTGSADPGRTARRGCC